MDMRINMLQQIKECDKKTTRIKSSPIKGGQKEETHHSTNTFIVPPTINKNRVKCTMCTKKQDTKKFPIKNKNNHDFTRISQNKPIFFFLLSSFQS